MSSETPGTKATRRDWLGLAVIALPCLLYSMDLTVLNLAVPAISADLKPSASQLLWIVDIYGFFVAGALITMGTLGDRIGRRKLLMIGAVAFGAASVLAAFSSTAEMLIFARALLGLSAATLAPSTLSLIRNMFLDPKERSLAIGVWISCFSAGGAIGPLVGGVLLNHFWWGSVFMVAVPIMVALLILTPLFLPEFKDPQAGRIDLLSVGLSMVAVLGVIFGIKKLAEGGIGVEAVLPIVVGLLMGIVFVRRQQRIADPLLDLSLFSSPAFSVSLGINVLAFFTAFGIFLLVAQYLQVVLGMDPLEAGLWSLPSAAAFIAGSMLAGAIASRFRPSSLVASGLLVAAAGFALLSQIGGTWSLGFIVAGYTVLSLGLAPVFTLSTDMIIGSVSPERAGTAAGMAETSSEFGGALGIALLGSFVTALYRQDMAAAMPNGVSEGSAAVAMDTAGGAMAEAVLIGGATGEALFAATRAAYGSAFQAAAITCVVVAVAAAVIAWLMLRNAAPTGDLAQEQSLG